MKMCCWNFSFLALIAPVLTATAALADMAVPRSSPVESIPVESIQVYPAVVIAVSLIVVFGLLIKIRRRK